MGQEHDAIRFLTEVLIADISAAAGRLKRAAIDAAMKQRGFQSGGDRYQYVGYGGFAVMAGGGGSVTRPDASGSGGGVVAELPHDEPMGLLPPGALEQAKGRLEASLGEEFESIRHSVDSALAPWHTLPQSATITDAGEGSRRMTAGLMGSVAQTESVLSGAGELGASLSRMRIESESFGGGSFDTFKFRYIDETPLRAVRLTALAELIGQAISAEAGIWRKVSDDLGEVLEEYRKGFASIAKGKPANPAVLFSIVEAAVNAAGLFASGGTAIALSGAGIVVSLVDSISGVQTPKTKEDERTFADVGSGLVAFREALRQLSFRIHDEEGAVIAGVNDAIGRVRANADQFQLAPAGIAAASDDGTMYADPRKNLSLARTFMPGAATAVNSVAGEPSIVSAEAQSALKRDYAVGWRIHGASSRITDLCNLLEELLREFAWDIDQGARSLEAAILDWAGAEEDNAQRAKDLATQIESGVTYSGRESGELLDIPRTTSQEPFITNLYDMMRGAGNDSGKGAN